MRNLKSIEHGFIVHIVRNITSSPCQHDDARTGCGQQRSKCKETQSAVSKVLALDINTQYFFHSDKGRRFRLG